MKITLDSLAGNGPPRQVSVSIATDDLTADEAVEMALMALRAWGYDQQNLADACAALGDY